MNPSAQTLGEPHSLVSLPATEQTPALLSGYQITEDERRGRGRRRSRRLLWLLVALFLAIASVAGYSYRRANGDPEAEIFVYTGKPTREVLLDLSGFIVPRTKVVISPQVGGIITRVLIPEEGKKVKTGDLLFEIDDFRYKAEYLQAEAALTTAEAQLEELQNGHEPEEKAHARALYDQAKVQESLATIEYERARKLPPTAIGKADYDRIVSNYHDARAAVKVQKTNVDLIEHKTRYEKIRAAEAEVKRARATRDRAKYFFDKTRIYAPGDFTVLQKNVNPGESIQADLVYTALCTLADLADMEAEIDVQERDLHLLRKGTPCEVIPDAYPDRAYRGSLARMQPLVNRQRGVVQVKISIHKPDEFLLPDMNARVLFLKDTPSESTGEDLPRIPLKALVPTSDPPAVFVLDGTLAQRRTIQVGSVVGDSVQVRDGLQPGDKILLPVGQPLREGKPVRLRGSDKDGVARKDAV